MPWRDRDRGGLKKYCRLSAIEVRTMYVLYFVVSGLFLLMEGLFLLPRTTAIQLPVGFPPRTSLIRVAPHALRGRILDGVEMGQASDAGKAEFEQSALYVARPPRSSGLSEMAPALRGCPSVFGCSRKWRGRLGTVWRRSPVGCRDRDRSTRPARDESHAGRDKE
jgi:hypothetical protein